MSDQRESVRDFGRELINARQYKGITLEQISRITRVDVRYFKAMEDGEWDLLPRPYMEAFLKAYAEAVGMHVPKVMKKYREMVYLAWHPESAEASAPGAAEESEQAETDQTKPTGEVAESPLRRRAWKYLLGVMFVVALAVIAVLVFRPGTEQSAPTDVPDHDLSPLGPEGTEVKDQMMPSADSITTQVAPRDTTQGTTIVRRRVPSELTLEALATESCWLRATIDNRTVKDVLLEPGQSLTLKARQEVHLVAGNAGGLELIFNGDSLGTLGPLNKPVTVVIGPDGIKSQRLGAQNPPGQMGADARRRRP